MWNKQIVKEEEMETLEKERKKLLQRREQIQFDMLMF